MMVESRARRAAVTILQNKFRQSKWRYISDFVKETKIPISEYTAGRILKHGDVPSVQTAMYLCNILCDSKETTNVLQLLGDPDVHKMISPDVLPPATRVFLKAFESLTDEHQEFVIRLIDFMRGEGVLHGHN